MAKIIDTSSGNSDKPEDFKYNTVWEYDYKEKKYNRDEDIINTDSGDKAYIYGEYNGTKYRGNNIKNNEVGDIFGIPGQTSRGTAWVGNVTEPGNFSYVKGNVDNVPQFFTDKEGGKEESHRMDVVYNALGPNPLSLRNENEDS